MYLHWPVPSHVLVWGGYVYRTFWVSIHITHMAIEDMLVSKVLVSFNYLIVADSPRRVSPVVKQPDHTAGQSVAFIAEVIWVQLYKSLINYTPLWTGI
jgi:hypothetical protein